MTESRELTDKGVRALVWEGKTTLHWDGGPDRVRGFAVRVTAGAKAFILRYSGGGHQREMTLGSFPTWTVRQARAKAAEIKRKVDDGEDPMEERHKLPAAQTLAEAVEQYKVKRFPRMAEGSRRGIESNLNKYILPALGTRKLIHVTTADITRLHSEIARTRPIAANRVMELIRTILNFAVKLGWLEKNPAAGISKDDWMPEEPRERYLSGAEVGRLLSALDEHPRQSSANAVRLLLATGARRNEVLGAVWSEFDLAEGIWHKPSNRTKQRKAHRVTLNAVALGVLLAMREAEDQRVAGLKAKGIIARPETALFPGRASETQRSMHTFWATICTHAGLKDVHVHDLRHSFASIAISSGATLPEVGKLLGHSDAATTQRYAHLADEAQRRASARVSDYIEAVPRPTKGGVVPLKR